ncbi:MAG: hypothetical protein ACXWKG_09860 [Limisphaerales bacterium]
MQTTDTTNQSTDVTTTPVLPQQSDVVTSTPFLPQQKARRRTGKVATLPADLRQFVNESLENGLSYEAIATELTAKGRPVAKHNIGTWARGGYRDYLHDKQQQANLRANTDRVITLAFNVRDEGRAAFEKLSSAIVAAKMIDAIQDFDSRRLHEKLNEKPELFFRAARVVNAQSLDYSRLRKVELQCKKYDDQTAEQRRLADEKKNPPRKGLTPETLREIERAMARL